MAFRSKWRPSRLSGANGVFPCPDVDHVLAHAKVTVDGYVNVVVYNQVRFLNVVFAEDHPDWAGHAVAAMEAREEADRMAKELQATVKELQLAPAAPSATQAPGSGTTKHGNPAEVLRSSVHPDCR